MSYKISGTEVINDSRKGIFTSANVGSFTTSTRPTSGISAGDIIFNSTLGILEVYDGSTWLDASGISNSSTAWATGGQVFHTTDDQFGSSWEESFYWHIFTANSNFILNETLNSVQISVGGGGGGGGSQTGGGGGGGMIVSEPGMPLPAGTYTIVVGAGGAGGVYPGGSGGQGGSSIFSDNNLTYRIMATGGGGGGGGDNIGGNGANGGGGGGNTVDWGGSYPGISGGIGDRSNYDSVTNEGTNAVIEGGNNGGLGRGCAGGGGAGAGETGWNVTEDAHCGNANYLPSGSNAQSPSNNWQYGGGWGGDGYPLPGAMSPLGRRCAGGGGGRNGGEPKFTNDMPSFTDPDGNTVYNNRWPTHGRGGAGGGGQGKSPNVNCIDHGNGCFASGSGGGGGAHGSPGPLQNYQGGKGGSGFVVIRYATGGNQNNQNDDS